MATGETMMRTSQDTYRTEQAAMLPVYEEHGFSNRAAYLASLATDTGLDLEVVETLADLLGPSEDFDGLVTTLDDIAGNTDT